ncbi:MAG: hypothetical protein C0595_06765 [Marinilabiliales bacterium]|nr:MAG: hypothetical protein C0595_06765 [Marinilabiliales bacterium]
METTYLSTAYFPPIEYFYHILKSGKIVIDNWETYKKQTYRNRCTIYSEKGLMPLTIPVTKPQGNGTKTNKILIADIDKWKDNHWKTIETAYMNSPFFEYYNQEIYEEFIKQNKELTVFNHSLLKAILKLLEIDKQINFSETFIIPDTFPNDYRFIISPKESNNLIFDEYIQVFADRHGFIENMSILDLIFNLGPEAKYYLENLRKK